MKPQMITGSLMHNFFKHRGVLIGLLLSLVAVIFPGSAVAETPVLTGVIERDALRVGMSADQPPFTFRSRMGSVVGFDVELAQAMAIAMNLELKIVEIPFGELLVALDQGRIDMVMSGVAITPQRASKVTFIGPYTLSAKSLLTTARVKQAEISTTEFNHSEVRVVALENSTSALFVEQNLPEASLYAIKYYNEGIEELLSGKIDAMVADIPILKLAMLRNPEAGLGIIEPPIAVEPIGIAIPGNDAQFANLVRNFLTAFEKTGLTSALRKRWLENDDWIAAAADSTDK